MDITNINEITIEDLFLVAEILNKVDIKIKYEKGKDTKAYGLDFLKCCFKSSNKIKKDIYQLLSNITNIEVVEIKKLTFKQLINIADKIVEVNNIEELFTQAVELM